MKPTPTKKRVIVVSALAEETAAVRTIIDRKRERPLRHLYGTGLVNIGLVNAAMNMAHIALQVRPDFVIVSGVCASLSKDVEVGTARLIKRVMHGGYGETEEGGSLRLLPYGTLSTDNPTAGSEWITPTTLFGTHPDLAEDLVSADVFLSDPDIAKRIRDVSGARLYDMETFAIGWVCELHKIPWAAVRTPTDCVESGSCVDTFLRNLQSCAEASAHFALTLCEGDLHL